MGKGGGTCLPLEMCKWVVVTSTIIVRQSTWSEYLNRQLETVSIAASLQNRQHARKTPNAVRKREGSRRLTRQILTFWGAPVPALFYP